MKSCIIVKPASQFVSQSAVSQSVCQSAIQSVCQLVSQSVSQSVQSVCLSVSQSAVYLQLLEPFLFHTFHKICSSQFPVAMLIGFYGSQPVKLTPCSTVLLQKLIITELVKKFPQFMETGCSSHRQQQPAASPCLSKVIHVYALPTHFLRSILILSSRICQGFPQQRILGHPLPMFYCLSWTFRRLVYNTKLLCHQHK